MPLLSGLSTGVKQGIEVEREGDLDGLARRRKIDPLSRQPLHRRAARRSAPKRFSTQSTIMSRIISPEMPAVVASPADHLAVVAVEGEGDAHDLAVPAGELQAVGAPADVRADRHHLAVMLAGRRRPVWRASSSPCFFISR